MKILKILLLTLLAISCTKRQQAFLISNTSEIKVTSMEFVQAIREGNLEKVRKAVEDEGVGIINNFYTTDSGEHFTPLQIAALNGQKSITTL